MGHFFLTRATWNTGTGVAPTDLESLDAKVFAAINGDRGGCWAPSTQIIFNSASGGALRLTGPLIISNGKLSTTGSTLITFDTGDFPRLGPNHKDRSRKYRTACLLATGYPSYGVRPHTQYAAIQAVAAKFQLSDGSMVPNTWRVPLRVSDRATLKSVAVSYRSLLGNAKMRIERVDSTGTATPLTSIAAGADASGYMVATPTNTTTDLTSGLPALNTAALPVDGGDAPANAVIDLSAYAYYLRVVEDQSLPSAYPSQCPVRAFVKYATTANITRNGTAAVDGIGLVAGDRILVKNQTNPVENGIYIAGAGAWGYADDSDIAGIPADGGKYPQGLIVPVRFGTVNAGSVWQLQQSSVATLGASPQTYATVPANPLTASSAFFARGNLYYDAVVSMTGISTDRWQ